MDAPRVVHFRNSNIEIRNKRKIRSDESLPFLLCFESRPSHFEFLSLVSKHRTQVEHGETVPQACFLVGVLVDSLNVNGEAPGAVEVNRKLHRHEVLLLQI